MFCYRCQATVCSVAGAEQVSHSPALSAARLSYTEMMKWEKHITYDTHVAAHLPDPSLLSVK